MLYRGPMGGGAASGKMGALVAARNKGGQYLRARAKPSGAVASPFQQEVRNALASLVVSWGGLTPDQRQGWNTYALNVRVVNRLGDSIQLSGQNWFIACNTPRLQGQLPPVNDAPTTFDRGTLLFNAYTVNVTGGNLVWSVDEPLAGDFTLLFYQGQPFSGARSKYYGSRRLAAVVANAGTATLSGGTITPVLPLPTTGAQGVLSVVVSLDDGRLSTPLDATFPGI